MESEKSDTQRKINSSSSEFLTESETDYLRKKIEECREYVLKWLQENPDAMTGKGSLPAFAMFLALIRPVVVSSVTQ